MMQITKQEHKEDTMCLFYYFLVNRVWYGNNMVTTTPPPSLSYLRSNTFLYLSVCLPMAKFLGILSCFQVVSFSICTYIQQRTVRLQQYTRSFPTTAITLIKVNRSLGCNASSTFKCLFIITSYMG